MEKIAKFGVAGMPPNYKGKSQDFFDWLKSLGINAFEIQCTYGFRVSEENIEYYKMQSKQKNIFLSMHAPYYINMGSLKEDVAVKSKLSMIEGIKLAQKMDCNRIIFHPGGGFGTTETDRKIAIAKIVDACNYIKDNTDMKDVRLYPEIGGKTANMGSLEEIITICQNCKICYPCIDIAHLHARDNGYFFTKDDFRKLLNTLKSQLPSEKFENIHFHAYTIIYTEKGEVRHLKHGENYSDGQQGTPNLYDFIDVLKEFNLTPWVISEARDSQDEGAVYMKNYYYGVR